MNILHATLAYPPSFAWGGPVKNTARVSRALAKRGHQVTVYCTNLLDKRDKISGETFIKEDEGVRIVYFNAVNIPRWPGTLGPIWTPDLQKYLNNEISQFDIIHLHGYRMMFTIPITRAARRSGIPFVVQPHGTIPVIINSKAIKRLYDLVLGGQEIKGMQALIALEEDERKQALSIGIPPERIVVIPNGIDTSEYEHVEKGMFKRAHRLPIDKPLIIFVGRINKKKGTDMLVKAFRHLDEASASLAIIGPDDGQLEEVEQLIHQFGLEGKVILPGLLTGRDLSAAYNDANIFVLPCRTDTFPSVLMEACLYNLPIVVTDSCEMAPIIKDKIADVVSFDEFEFANAMKNLLEDRNKYEKYRTNCPDVLKNNLSINNSTDKMIGLYENIVGQKQ